MGFIWLGTVPLTNGLISQVFGVRYITTLFGFVFFGHQLGSFLGVWLGGLVYEATHSYDLIWLGAIALGCWQPCCIGPSTTANCRARAWRRHGPEGRPRRPRTGTAPGRYSGRCVPAPIVMCSMRQGRPPWPCARRPWARHRPGRRAGSRTGCRWAIPAATRFRRRSRAAARRPRGAFPTVSSPRRIHIPTPASLGRRRRAGPATATRRHCRPVS